MKEDGVSDAENLCRRGLGDRGGGRGLSGSGGEGGRRGTGQDR